MVEGPTAHLYSLRITREMYGENIEEVFYRGRKAYIEPNLLLDKKIGFSETYGKNILIHVNDYSIRIHLMLYGSIHIYLPEDNLLKSFKRVRLLLKGTNKKLVVYNAPIVEIGEKERILNYLKSSLGPDPLRKDWDRIRAIEKIKSRKKMKIGVVLLDQSVIAGIGNILRNEILFRAGINPERIIGELSDDDIERIVDVAEELSTKFLEAKMKKGRIKPLLLVYNRYGKRCKVCGSTIKFYIQKEINRKTFVCESCQK